MKTILTLAFLGISVIAPAAVLPAAAQSVAAEQTVTFIVDNMTCALCPVTVRRAMEGVAGVHDVRIDFDARTATVTFDPKTADIDAIAAASAQAGYPAHPTS